MAYHIFTLRKLMLTDQMNSTNAKMMRYQFERDDVEDELLELYDELYGYDLSNDSAEMTSKETRENANRKTEGGDLTDEEKGRIRKAILEAQQKENRLDQLLKKLETEYSEAQTELKSVETQEAQALQMSVPKYGGITQQG